ncbi:MAG: hypothetical protein ACPL5I_15045, partial [Thermodesulfobacteriota bacterium]
MIYFFLRKDVMASPKGAAISLILRFYEIATVATLPRDDIMTLSRWREGLLWGVSFIHSQPGRAATKNHPPF